MKRIPDEDRAGLYLTAIVHLAVLIVLLASGLGYSLSRETAFVLDYSHYDEVEKMQQEIARLQEEAAFKESVSRRLQQTLAENGISGSGSSEIKNVAVDRSALKDDRGTDAEQLYKDAERLQRELAGGYEIPDEDRAALPSPKASAADEAPKRPSSSYSGPSVISYELEGRKASRLPIPAYRCMGAGQVRVNIIVNPKGEVISAKVDDGASSQDACLRSFAVRAARLSKFTINTSAPAKQSGYIVYEFIAQ